MNEEDVFSLGHVWKSLFVTWKNGDSQLHPVVALERANFFSHTLPAPSAPTQLVPGWSFPIGPALFLFQSILIGSLLWTPLPTFLWFLTLLVQPWNGDNTHLKTVASADQFTQRQNREECYYCNHFKNLISHQMKCTRSYLLVHHFHPLSPLYSPAVRFVTKLLKCTVNYYSWINVLSVWKL